MKRVYASLANGTLVVFSQQTSKAKPHCHTDVTPVVDEQDEVLIRESSTWSNIEVRILELRCSCLRVFIALLGSLTNTTTKTRTGLLKKSMPLPLVIPMAAGLTHSIVIPPNCCTADNLSAASLLNSPAQIHRREFTFSTKREA